MRANRGLVALAAVGLLTGAAEGDPPKKRPGEPEPWQDNDGPAMSGDRWAILWIDIDAKGKATRCRIGESNIRDQGTRFFMCRAMMLDFRTDPIMKDGVAVPAIVKRRMLMPGPQRRKLQEKARKRYLAEHPEARN